MWGQYGVNFGQTWLIGNPYWTDFVILGTEKPNLRSERAYFKPGKSDLRSES